VGASAASDLGIIGFGFSGLAVLAHTVRARSVQSISIVADDDAGLGLAYRTADPRHLLNVRAERMGVWASAPEDFVGWLSSSDARRSCARLGVEVPGAGGYAPRALYAEYLRRVRASVLQEADAAGIRVRFVRGRATSLQPLHGCWSIGVGTVAVLARTCVLATGNETRRVFGALEHPALHTGPWGLARVAIDARSGSAALIGSGLTAVDAVLTLRASGYGGELIALSRNGLLPKPHSLERPPAEVPPDDFDPDVFAQVGRLRDVIATLRRLTAEGHDWRAVLDALRPQTPAIWQRMPPADRVRAIERWGPIWNVHRHRMAPPVAEAIERELRSGGLRVLAVSVVTPTVSRGRLRLEYSERGGDERVVLEPDAVIDCTGPVLDCRRGAQPLLRGLVNAGICVPHHTGLGLATVGPNEVGRELYAIGSLLTGQLWETIAVPELRGQAAAIAAAVAGVSAQDGPGPSEDRHRAGAAVDADGQGR